MTSPTSPTSSITLLQVRAPFDRPEDPSSYGLAEMMPGQMVFMDGFTLEDAMSVFEVDRAYYRYLRSGGI